MQFYSKILFDSLNSDINQAIYVIVDCFVEIYCVKEVEQNLLPKNQTNPFYIRTKEAPSEYDGLESQTTIKFHENWPNSSGEEKF